MNRKFADLVGKNIVVYDLEIKRSIGENGIGWGDHDKMGISVAAAFDYRDYRFRIFLDDNMDELVDRMNEPGTLVCGFNIKSFDNKLLRADPILVQAGKVLKPDSELLVYDMMVESLKGAGLSRSPGGFKLDDHLQAMGLPMKTDNGVNAPIWYKEGRLGKVIDYGLNDGRCEKLMLDKVYITQKMAVPSRPGGYSVRCPLEVLSSAT